MSRLVRLLIAVLIGAASGATVISGAQAAACAPGTGVTVVVGSKASCVPGGAGKSAREIFKAAGHALEDVRTQPGMICTVDGLPTDMACVRAPASNYYWGLFWSNGATGQWIYSSLGVNSLKIPEGGSVAFVFQEGSGKTFPSVSPNVGIAKSSQKPKTDAKPRKPETKAKASASKSTAAPGADAAPSPGSAGATTPAPTSGPSSETSPKPKQKRKKDKPEPSASIPAPTATSDVASDETSAATAPQSSENSDSRASTFVGIALVTALLAAIGVTAWRRRTHGG